MTIKFITQYPAWFIIGAIVLAAAITLLFYYRDEKLSEIKRWKIRMMMALRFLALFLIAILLLGPMVESTQRNVEKPVVLFAQDNSSSLLYSADSAKIRSSWPEKIRQLRSSLSDNYDFRLYTFGEELRRDTSINYTDRQTDFSRLFAQVNNSYSGKNLGAVVVASDGIYTQGANPVYASSVASYPVYTVALGDTSPRPDAAISDLQVNKIAYLGNKFPVRIFLNATELQGKSMEVNILHKEESVFSKKFTPDNNNFSKTIDAELEAKEAGNQTYTITVSEFPEEKNKHNNSRSFVIEVIDSKQKILMLAQGLHPDIGAVKNTLEQIRSYEVTFKRMQNFNGNIKPYNLLIFHQLPTRDYPLDNILKKSNQRDIPRLFIGGQQTHWQKLAAYAGGFKVQQDGNSMDQAYPALNDGFTVFRISDEMKSFFEIVPPLNVPFGKYSLQSPYEVLTYQKLKGIKTEKPLAVIAGATDERPKTGIIAGTGLWHWRIYDHVENKTHRNFDSFINKIVQFLALKAKKEHITTKHAPVFSENENVYFEVQVHNEVYEVVKNADVAMKISSKDDKRYSFKLSPMQTNAGVVYVLNAGIFPKGSYEYTITADIGDRVYEKSGGFKVLPVQIETINTRADHRVLYRLAARNNGKMLQPDNLENLKQALEENEQIQPVVHTSQQLTEIIHWKWLFFVILLFLGLEWFYRKFEGAY